MAGSAHNGPPKSPLRMFSLSILGRRWPAFWQIFSEAAWHAGQRMLLSEKIAERTYQRMDRRERLPVRNFDTSLPPRYNYRIPGVAMEFWPVDEDNPGGCENYGWGATLPALIVRNIIGFREAGGRDVFLLAPALPRTACSPSHRYGGGGAQPEVPACPVRGDLHRDAG